MSEPRSILLLTHSDPNDTAESVRSLAATARERGIELLVPSDEAEKHALGDGDVTVVDAQREAAPDVVVVLGGDGTILRGLREWGSPERPVFAFNFGAIGFLSTIEGDQFEDALERVLAGDYETLHMPALAIEADGERFVGVNDISFHRRPDERVAELAYLVEGEQLGRVRCDGLVASTPVGSTGYNLANGGPVLAWGVEGYVVSFIAPHTLTARALVVATDAVLTVQNCSESDGVDVTTDGRSVCSLDPGGEMHVRFSRDRVALAQLPGTSYYHRLREKFGRLAY